MPVAACKHKNTTKVLKPSQETQTADNVLLEPVSINEAGVDVVRPFHSSDWLQTHTRRLVGHDVHQPVLELVAWQVGTYEPRCVSLGTGQTLEHKEIYKPINDAQLIDFYD